MAEQNNINADGYQSTVKDGAYVPCPLPPDYVAVKMDPTAPNQGYASVTVNGAYAPFNTTDADQE